ncbi:MAG: nicotinate-nucleotide--dimethylbenzimidazole phosphoribosyltransferase [Candidatus Binatia bacterium]|nr:nicotinate-nucleotide--dimethylbenzimidazole phosphoribosyltransferase [Candidatus Binatia bacterium]
MEVLERTLTRIQPLDRTLADRVQSRLDQLTKPQGSLGRLEELALRYALITGQERPRLQHKVLFVFCADHGVSGEGVSAYPKEVTAQMVYNFLRGGAAISVLARHLHITVKVVDVGVDHDFDPQLPGLIQRKVAYGTANFAYGPAMTRAAAVQAIEIGIALTEEAIAAGADLLGVGEMGIGNSTTAAALLSALSGLPAEELTGAGTGIDATTRRKKIAVIQRALACHRPDPADPIDVLAKVGGYELAAIAGVCLAGASRNVPVVVDGFIATAAAWVACALHPEVKERLIFSHLSAESGHGRVLAALQVKPLLDFAMRLGEGTGAALGMHLVEMAVRLLNEMATFAEAGVAQKHGEGSARDRGGDIGPCT